jgi:hypothetical protein
MTVVQLVERERARLRASNTLTLAALVVALTAAVIGGGAWLLGGARWIALPRATPVLVWLALIGLNVVAIWLLVRRGRRTLGRSSIAAAIEQEQSLRAGALRGVIEVAESAISRRVDQAMAGKLEQVGPTLAPQLLKTRRSHAMQVSAVALVTLALLLWAAPSLSDGLLAIRRPFAAWSGSLVPALSFKSLPKDLLRGEPLRIQVEAAGRRTIVLTSRTTGEGWQTASLRVDGETGIASTTLNAVRGDLMLVATDGRNVTDTVLVNVVDKPFVGGVTLRATYPKYLGRAAEGLPVGEPAQVPRGTVIAVSGRASTALDRVYIRGERDSISFAVSGHSFTGTLTPKESSRWSWFAFGERVAIADVPLPLEIDVIPDSLPTVELIQPATDTLVAAVDKIQLQVTASDDHGLDAIELIATRKVARGKVETPVVGKLAAQQGTVWNGAPVIDLAPFELQAGDALRLQIVATDNSPWKQRGVSREVVIRIPTMEERRSLARSAADSTANAARNAATQQKSLEQRTDEASRERGNRGNQPNGQPANDAAKGKDKEMSYEAAEKARALAQEQRDLANKIDQLKDAAAALQEQLKEAGALDSSLSRQLREAQDLLRDALTPEMMEQMKKLENSTRELNSEQSRDALKNMAEQQKRLREQLEKSAEMLKRAALEGAMETLKDEAKEIAEKQREMADSSAKMNPEGRKETGEKLADRSEQLAKDVKQLQDRLQKEKADAASQKANSAQQHAEKSEQQMRQQDSKSAAQQMEQAAKDLQDAREQQVGEWKKELTEALDQSIQELLQMAREEAALEEKARQAGRDQAKTDPLRGQQSAVQQGVDKTAEKLQKEGQKSSLLSGRAQRAMSEAMQKTQQATQQLTEQRGNQQASGALGDAAEALNRAAAALARDRERANSANSATGFSEMIQQMQEMAKKQGSINAQAQGLMPIPGQGQMSPESQATARMLARQQRNIANQLEEISDAAGGDRAGELAKEARQLAESLEQTRVDAQTVARQQQLFRRMLDAGRSLEKEEREDNDKREAKSAKGDEKFDPGANAVRGKAGQKYGEPTWDELRGLSADERRAILEYFKRINAKQP